MCTMHSIMHTVVAIQEGSEIKKLLLQTFPNHQEIPPIPLDLPLDLTCFSYQL